MGFKDQLNSLLNEKGMGESLFSSGNQSSRNVYPAVVVSNQDPLEMNRIKARIVSLNQTGVISGGRDSDKEDAQLPFCVPIMPNHIHVRPLEGEMVIVVLENPSDNSAPRYWIGPVINSKLKLKFQSYEEADEIFRSSKFNPNTLPNSKEGTSLAIPAQSDIAIQGRDDADIILKNREVVISAGKFVDDKTLALNVNAPCNIQLKQYDKSQDGSIPAYSQQNLYANNINLYSPFGKFRKKSEASIESSNQDLGFLGDLAIQLHPLPFGDNLIKLLDLMIKIILTHIHTPQKELVETPESQELSAFTLEGRLQELISKHIRIN